MDALHVPSWVEKYQLSLNDLESKRKSLSLDEQRKFLIDKTGYLKVLNLLKLE